MRKHISKLLIAIMLLTIVSVLSSCELLEFQPADYNPVQIEPGKINPEQSLFATSGLAYEVNAGGKTCTITGIGTCKESDIFVGNYIDDYIITAIGDYAFDGCKSVKSITIGDSVTTIGDFAFAWCTHLASVTIGDSVTNIGKSTFYHCSNLANITIGDSVTSSGDYVFYYCKSLKSITIGESVTTIGDYAFASCFNMESVIIPESVIAICNDAFYDCRNLTNVYYAGNRSEWEQITIGSYNSKLTDASIHYNYVPEE